MTSVISYFTFLESFCISELVDCEWCKDNKDEHRNNRGIIVLLQSTCEFVDPGNEDISSAGHGCRTVFNDRISTSKEEDDSKVVDVVGKAHDDQRHCLVENKWKSNALECLET